MKLNIQKVRTLFSREKSDFRINEFDNRQIHKSVLPFLWSWFDNTISQEQFIPINRSTSTLQPVIEPEMIDIQCHNRSIFPHTDDIPKGQYFQLVVLDLKATNKSKWTFNEERPVFSYYDGNGHKHSQRLLVGDSVVFNPRREHSMIYYGDIYTVAIRTVVKLNKSVV